MNTDKELLCSEKQAITDTAVSTDSILMTGNLGADRTRNLRCFAQIETALAGGTGTSITAEVIQADDSALTSNIEVLYTGATVLTAAALAGKVLVDIPMPKVTKAYLGFRYTRATGNFATGNITAGLVVGSDTALTERPSFEAHGF